MSDAILIVSFGGPDRPEEVMPFLENVTRGRPVPRERLLEVARHYHHFGGRSPINDQNRALIAALRDLLANEGPHLPVYWGNRNWHPLLADTLRQMGADGVKRAFAFVTSAYSSYSGCRQYREDLERARAAAGPGAPEVLKLRAFYNHPGFIEPMAARVRAAFDQLAFEELAQDGAPRAAIESAEFPSSMAARNDAPLCTSEKLAQNGAFVSSMAARRGSLDCAFERRERAALVFTAHSIPLWMAQTSPYVAQLEEACRLVAERAGRPHYRLVYQSRSGPPSEPWLEPDILEFLRESAAQDAPRDVIVAPIGFISDHMEVAYDLDTEAQALSKELGLQMVRAATVDADPQFIAMIRELVLERMGMQAEKRALGMQGPSHDVCPEDCCPGPRAKRP
jgi:ferrochelatase